MSRQVSVENGELKLKMIEIKIRVDKVREDFNLPKSDFLSQRLKQNEKMNEQVKIIRYWGALDVLISQTMHQIKRVKLLPKSRIDSTVLSLNGFRSEAKVLYHSMF